MEKKESILSPVKRIRAGISLPHHKKTAETETEEFNPQKVYIPMIMNIGAPCVPCVKVGDKVFEGTKIADSEAFVSAPIHSSISGTVTAITSRDITGQKQEFIEIESDGKNETDQSLKPFPVKNNDDLIEAAKNCGLVGLGGAGFPTQNIRQRLSIL